jgi:hypothetical protein
MNEGGLRQEMKPMARPAGDTLLALLAFLA